MTMPRDVRLITSLKSLARAASLAVILIGGLVLGGWAFDIISLESVVPGLATMKPNTALGFILAGASLWLQRSEPTEPAHPARWHLARASAAMTGLIGLLSLSQDLLGWEWGIDLLLFRDPPGQVGTVAPGRMSPITAFNFGLVGGALLLLDVKQRAAGLLAQFLALVVGSVALFALIGYAYSIQILYHLNPFSSMALHTALTLLVLALAILGVRPEQGLMAPITRDTVGGFMVRRLLPAAIIVPFLLGWLHLIGQRAGLYETEVGVALFSLATVVILAGLIWWNAHLLYQADLKRQQVEEALHESEARFSKAFQASPVGIAITRLADGRFVDVNDSYLHLVGYQRAEVIDHTTLEVGVVSLEDRQKIVQALQTEGSVRNLEIGVPTKTGQIRQVLTSIERIELGAEACSLSIIYDITERKRAEEKLQQLNQELQRSNAELEQFAYIASHDLQEPLRAVTGTLQLLQKRYAGQLDARADELIGHAVDGAARMRSLITDLLAYSRLGRRGQSLRRIEGAVILQDALANLTTAIQESQAVISHDPLPAVMADPTQLTQLFQNLIGNAIKFRGDKPPAIHIRVEPKETECLFAVRDNGIGMEAQHFERIFGVFQRLHTRQEYAGTGIGLAVCKKIVERHGGHIWVESAVGQGSTFYFTLPAQLETEPLAEE